MLEDPRDLYAQGWTTLTVWVPPSEREGLKSAASLSEALAEALTRRRLDFLVAWDGPAAQGGEESELAAEERQDLTEWLGFAHIPSRFRKTLKRLMGCG